MCLTYMSESLIRTDNWANGLVYISVEHMNYDIEGNSYTCTPIFLFKRSRRNHKDNLELPS